MSAHALDIVPEFVKKGFGLFLGLFKIIFYLTVFFGDCLTDFRQYWW